MKEILLPTLICNAFYSMAIPPGDPRRETFGIDDHPAMA